MPDRDVVYGLLDTSAVIRDRDLSARCRELTLAWCRYDYHGRIIEGKSVDAIVAQAVEQAYDYCFILGHGQVIHERWIPGDEEGVSVHQALTQSCRASGSMVAGTLVTRDDGQIGIDDRCLLIDLDMFERCGKPAFGRAGTGFVEASRHAGIPVTELAEPIRRRVVDLDPRGRDDDLLRDILMSHAIDLDTCDKVDLLDPPQREFLDTVREQTSNARRGVFLLNIESHADVESPHRDFVRPVTSLYCVASGFKPNRILQTHGMSAETRVCFFDYSANALRVRQAMVEDWDGIDFPRFMRHLFARFPQPETFYQLWAGATPATIDWSIVDRMWQEQLAQMGGARAFAQHWEQYRQLRHEYIPCDVLDNPDPLLERIQPGQGAVLWFSNAAFTVYANWRYAAAERRRRYYRLIERLAAANAGMLLYGSDYVNSNVNDIPAGEYWRRFQIEDRGALHPCNLYRKQVRM